VCVYVCVFVCVHACVLACYESACACSEGYLHTSLSLSLPHTHRVWSAVWSRTTVLAGEGRKERLDSASYRCVTCLNPLPYRAAVATVRGLRCTHTHKHTSENSLSLSRTLQSSLTHSLTYTSGYTYTHSHGDGPHLRKHIRPLNRERDCSNHCSV
jgi:hypothetical protein